MKPFHFQPLYGPETCNYITIVFWPLTAVILLYYNAPGNTEEIILQFCLSGLTANRFRPAGYHFLPLCLLPEEREKHWKELELNLGPTDPQMTALALS